MELFNKKYVYFMWDDSLKGKSVFVSDHIDNLRNYVNNKVVVRVTVDNSITPNYPFYTDEAFFKFVYYDPNYDYKLAFSNGDTVEVCISKSKNTWIPVKDLDDLDDPTGTYRIVLKDEDPEELVTYEELAEWLTKGNGLVMDNATCKVSTGLNLTSNQLEDIVSKDCLVRRHGDKGWHSPTKEYIYNK